MIRFQSLILVLALALAAAGCGGSAAPIEQQDAGQVGTTPDGGKSDGGSSGASSDAGTGVDAGPLGGGDWPQFRHDVSGDSNNPGVFAKSEVANLQQLWTAELGQYVYTQPVLAGGVAYFTTAFTGEVVALDANTGQKLWLRTLNQAITTSCDIPHQPGFWGSAAVAGQVVYVASPDGNVYALSASDGSTVWASQVANPTASGNGEQLESSPAVSTALGKLFVGVAASSDLSCGHIAGRIISVYLATGLSSARTLVDPGQTGAPVWSSTSIDEAAGIAYASSGDIFDANGGSEPLANAIIAFNPIDLTILSHWQNPTPLTNADFGASPTLFNAAGGAALVAAASKDGNLYVLDRTALATGPIWQYQLAIVDPAKPGTGGDPVGGWGSIVSPTFAAGTLYAAGGRTPDGAPGSVVAFEPGSGAVKWRHLTPGYVIDPVAAVGEVLIVESSKTDFTGGWLEVLDAATGATLRTVPAEKPIFGAPAVGRGLILFSDSDGHVTALAVPDYRP